jgi:NADH-quinone oxidoreductase subunit G
MAKIYIDDLEYTAEEGKNLLEVCLSLGLDLPYFCWHPKLGAVGACRQCAVIEYKDAEDKRGRIVMACMTPVREGTRISLKDPSSTTFRTQIIESLMTNHPHDCPTCDEGGHCHLQDMTVMTGHNYRKYRFTKRTHRNQYLGPFITHEMNRCIACYRCVRFYKDFAGGKDLDVSASRNQVYFGRFEDGPLENEFSGNLVEVCPTGVFTDKTFRQHYTRKWDLTYAPSVCNQCSVGCNTIASERYGTIRSISSRYNGEVNGYFICDRGRFGYGYMNSNHRISKAFKNTKGENEFSQLEASSILDEIKEKLKSNTALIGIGSPRASLESNFALMSLVGKENFYSGMSDKEHQLTTLAYEILKKTPTRSLSLREVEEADAVLVLGEDLTNTAPMLALAVRQSVRQKPREKTKKISLPVWNDKAIRDTVQTEKGPLYIATSVATKLDDVATSVFRTSPDEIARFGYAIAHELNSGSPAVTGISDELMRLVREIALNLKEAKKPLVISGTSSGSEAILKATANIARALFDINNQSGISLTFPEANSPGIAMMDTKKLSDAFAQEKVDTVVVLENDLYRRAEEKAVNSFLEKARTVIVLDYIHTATTKKADYCISAAPAAESTGTLVNNEGRAQRFFQVFVPEQNIQASWRWLQAISSISGIGTIGAYEILDDFTKAIEKAFPVFSGISQLAPPPDYRIGAQKIAREPHRYSGRTAMFANKTVHEPKPPSDRDTAMTYTMEGFYGEQPSSDIPFFWSPGWNSVQSVNKYQIEIGGHLHGGDPGKRLIEPGKADNTLYYKDVPQAAKLKTSEWLLFSLYHIFGSEELSAKTAAVKERALQPYLGMNLEDAQTLGLKDGSEVQLEVIAQDKVYTLPVLIRKGIPKGMAGLPASLGLPFMNLPGSGKIKGVKV